MTKSLTDATRDFLGPIMAEYSALITDYPADMPVTISFGGYKHETTLDGFKQLDRAYAQAIERQDKAAATRRNRKAAGTLI